MKNSSFVLGTALAFLAVGIILLLSGGWGGMMSVGLGEIIILVAGTVVFIRLAEWVLRSGGRQK